MISAAPAIGDPEGTPPPDKMFMEKMQAREEQLYKELNLSDEQKKLLEDNKAQHRGQMKTLFERMKEKKDALRMELQKDKLDTGKITQMNNELKKVQAQLLDQKLEGILAVRKILTPEQFKKFSANMDEPREHFKHRKGEEKEKIPAGEQKGM